MLSGLLQCCTDRNIWCADEVCTVSTDYSSSFGVGLNITTTFCQLYTASIGYQFANESFSRLLSLSGNASTKLLWHTCSSSASQWKVSNLSTASLLQLDASRYREYRHRLVSGVCFSGPPVWNRLPPVALRDSSLLVNTLTMDIFWCHCGMWFWHHEGNVKTLLAYSSDTCSHSAIWHLFSLVMHW